MNCSWLPDIWTVDLVSVDWSILNAVYVTVHHQGCTFNSTVKNDV